MTITPQLSRKLQEALGDEAATDLITWLQRMEAQRAELRELNEMNFARFDARLNEARHESKADLADFRLVTQADIAGLREATQADIAELRQEMRAAFATQREATRADITGLREEMRAGFAGQREEIAGMEGRLEARFERRFGDLLKWSFVFWVGAVGAVALLAGVLG